MRAVLISTYELGRQPFGLASPAAWLRRNNVDVVCLDLSVQPLSREALSNADLVAFYLPMHTAARIASVVIDRVRILSPSAHLCAYGLYAPTNATYLKRKGIETVIGGEFEEGLVNLALQIAANGTASPQARGYAASKMADGRISSKQDGGEISLARQQFIVPERTGLPILSKYAHLEMPGGSSRVVGYTEASRGCKYLCRHCPVVPVYKGQLRIVQREVVMADIRQQVQSGAAHITFGDPDFFNGIKHSIDLVTELHQEFPDLTYDVTIKIEHLLKHRRHLRTLRETGCLFITSAVESLDDRVLKILDKGHTRQDFYTAVELCREAGVALSPTFVAFNPWISLDGYEDLLSAIVDLGLVDNVAPVQLALRLLIPPGSYLLGLPEVARLIGRFDEEALCYRWQHRDPRVDLLQRHIESLVAGLTKQGAGRRRILGEVWNQVQSAKCEAGKPVPDLTGIPQRAEIPYLNEPWYC